MIIKATMLEATSLCIQQCAVQPSAKCKMSGTSPSAAHKIKCSILIKKKSKFKNFYQICDLTVFRESIQTKPSNVCSFHLSWHVSKCNSFLPSLFSLGFIFWWMKMRGSSSSEIATRVHLILHLLSRSRTSQQSHCFTNTQMLRIKWCNAEKAHMNHMPLQELRQCWSLLFSLRMQEWGKEKVLKTEKIITEGYSWGPG